MRLAIRVKPGASRTEVGGLVGEEIAVAITAQAHDGEANMAAIAALAKALGIGKTRIRIVKGATFRSKVVEISLDPGARSEVMKKIWAMRTIPSHK
ncbi:MAG: DUF167 domain-containing protein [Actinobacteria bacterium]|nr:DUF167 domain-containing protein [Actinomycetota bacterium]MSY27675.1 DUF167 domain-containing protein [Actinomycetota bacterium]MSZ87356.1 DUF167 domain-containing protein [Actinomycetota bacterium]MTB13611.1 DUF167 domain-containing protein [Actinomycetota bacterium]MTB25325.1 DUF167 domain-containing protein [Actinomycetota bacterium]